MKGIWVLAAVLLVLAVPAAPAAAEPDREVQELTKIAEGLHHGVLALDALGRKEEAEHLERILREVKEKIARLQHGEHGEGERSEREVAEHHLEVLRLAFQAMREAERKDAMELLEHAIHARELGLQGRSDPEARRIRESAPGPGVLAELLLTAGKLWRKFENPEKAEFCEELGRFFAERAKREKKRGGADREREIAKKHIEILMTAAHGLREADRADLAEQVEHAVHAMKLGLEGRRDREAAEIRETAPNPGQLAELLHYAAERWDEFGHESKAAACRELGDHYGEIWQRSREHREDRERHAEREGRGDAARERLDGLGRQIDELAEVLEHLRRELEEMRRELR